MSIENILKSDTISELLDAIDDFCRNAVAESDNDICMSLKEEVSASDKDILGILGAYLCACEDGDEIIEALHEFSGNCSGFAVCDSEMTKQITKAEFEEVLDDCEEKCMLTTCIEEEHKLRTAEIEAYNTCENFGVRFKNENICLLLPRVDISSDKKKYISDTIGEILYGVIEKRIKPETIRTEMNRYVPGARNDSRTTKELFKKYLYDVVVHKDRKPGIYLEFDDHMRQLFSIEFYKRLIVQYIRE